MMADVSDSEAKLALELKELCEPYDNKWKEINQFESAKVLHKLGFLYKVECANEDEKSLLKKIKFIQSAGLLNCALVRQPLTEEIKEDLRLLCANLLQSSKAQREDFDLVGFASNLKQEIKQWRNDVKDQATTLLCIPDEIVEDQVKQFEGQKIIDVESLQGKITDKYKYFMKKVSQVSIEVLGKTPCDFSLVGLGSMAREEITPFSDFENIIILQEGVQQEDLYDEMLDYFRWYAVIFQVIVINLGETSLHSFAIPSLNDYTTKGGNWFFDAITKRGISFDGMMPHASKTPLGRQPTKNKPWIIELIKPVSEMAEYLTQEQNLKNGYHLSDILTYSCLVAGSENVYNDFDMKRNIVLKEEKDHHTKEAIGLIKNDMKDHSTKLGISSIIDNDSYYLKQFAYRSTTAFITGLAKLHGIDPGSCFALIRGMQSRKLVSEEFSHKLQYAVAIACEIRLKTYLEQECQYDCIAVSEEGPEDVSLNLINAVGRQSCYDYLEIACCLQYDVITCFKLDISFKFHNLVTLSIAISSLLHLYDRLLAAKQYIMDRPVLPHQLENDEETVSDYCRFTGDDRFWHKPRVYVNIDGRQKEMQAFTEQSEHVADVSLQPSMYLGSWYVEMQNFNHQLMKFFPKPSLTTLDCSHLTIFSILWDVASYLYKTEVYFEAECCYKTALKLLEKNAHYSSDHCNKIKCLYGIGKCLLKIGDYDLALKNFCEALTSFLCITGGTESLEYFEEDCYRKIGMCQLSLEKYDEACNSFDTALMRYRCHENIDPKEYDHFGLCLLRKGNCLCAMNKFKDALVEFESLYRYYFECNDSVLFKYKANCLRHLGTCLQSLDRHEEASERLLEAIQMYRKDLDHCDRSKQYQAITFIRIGFCFRANKNYQEALDTFFKCLDLRKELFQLSPNDPFGYLQFDIALSHKQIGNCYLQLNSFKEGIESLKQAIQIVERLCHQHKSFSWALFSLYRRLGEAFSRLGDRTKDSTKDFFDQSLQNILKLPKTLENNHTIAYLYTQIGGIFFSAASSRNISAQNRRNLKAKAKSAFENAEALQASLSLTSHGKIQLAFIFKNLGQIFSQETLSRHHSEAISYFQKALTFFEANNKKYRKHIAWLLKNIGMCSKHLQRWEEATKSFEGAKNIYNLMVENDTKFLLDLAFVMKYLGRCYQYQGLHDDAISCWEESNKTYSQLQDPSRFKLDEAWIYKKLAISYEAKNEDHEAISFYQRALRIHKSMLIEKEYTQQEIAFIKRRLLRLGVSIYRL